MIPPAAPSLAGADVAPAPAGAVAAAAAGATAVPHDGQNRAPAATSVPHDGQCTGCGPSGWPQLAQNRAPGRVVRLAVGAGHRRGGQRRAAGGAELGARGVAGMAVRALDRGGGLRRRHPAAAANPGAAADEARARRRRRRRAWLRGAPAWPPRPSPAARNAPPVAPPPLAMPSPAPSAISPAAYWLKLPARRE